MAVFSLDYEDHSDDLESFVGCIDSESNITPGFSRYSEECKEEYEMCDIGH